ncbi:MAG: DUF4835 family protein [Saprospiraceae bacterium]|nr:DUF4835 family protein [Saprospiraceae bacterium]
MARLGLALLMIFCTSNIIAQEFIATVNINTPRLQKADPSLFEDMKQNIESYFNELSWTDNNYKPEERISITINLNINEEVTNTSFKGELQIQATRPTYNSNYETVLLSHNDRDIVFNYEPNQVLQFSEFGFSENLSQVLGFYIYMILGLDGDSFELKGGDDYFQKAQDVINAITQDVSRTFPGWAPEGSTQRNRSRYWMAENILSPRIKNYRQAYYDYHRQALDIMYYDTETAKSIIISALAEIRLVAQSYPNCMLLQMFSSAKSNELIEIFSLAELEQKREFIRLMSKIDPVNSSKYRSINSTK